MNNINVESESISGKDLDSRANYYIKSWKSFYIAGPDSKRLSGFEKRPTLAPRPSLNPYVDRSSSQVIPSSSIGFESIENELKSHNFAKPPHPGSSHKSDDEAVELRKPSQAGNHKRLSSFENAAGANPTHHPNAVPMFGFTPPAPLERTKFDNDKPRPSVPERPTVIKLQGIFNFIISFT